MISTQRSKLTTDAVAESENGASSTPAPVVSPWVRMLDLCLLLGGLAGTGYAVWMVRQDAVKNSEHTWLWWLMLAFALLGGFGLRRMEAWVPDAAPAAHPVAFVSVRRRLWGLGALLAAVLLTGWVVVRLWPNYHQWQGTPLPWGIALLLTALGGWLIGAIGGYPSGAGSGSGDWGSGIGDGASRPLGDRGAAVVADVPTPQSPMAMFPRWLEIALLIAILALAIFLRVYRLDEIPAAIYVDETNASLDALHILEGRRDSPFGTGWYETPNGYIYYMAALYKLFGANYWTLKAASLIPAILTVPALYFLARLLFGPLAALIATFLIAISRWHMTMSRWGWNELMPPLFQIVGTFFLIRGLRERRALDYALGGLITGLTIYTYLSSRLAIGTIGLFALYWILADPDGPWTSWKRHWRGLVLFGVAALIALAPIGVTYVTHPFTFVNRAAEINIFHEVRAEGSWRPLRENVWRHVQLFYQQGDPTGRQNLPGEPQTDPVTGTLLAVGLAYALLHLGDRRRGLLWLWIVIAMAGGYLSELHIDSPNSYRTLTAVPAVALVGGDVAARLARGFWHLAPTVDGRGLRWAGSGVAALILLPVLAFGAWWEIHTYFVRQANALSVQNSFNQTETEVAHQVVEALQEGATVYLSHRFYHFSPLRFLVYGALQRDPARARIDGNPLEQPPFQLARPEVDLPIPATGGGALLLLDNYYASLADHVRGYYPNAAIETIRGPGGGALFLRIWIPEMDLEALQGVRLTVVGEGDRREQARVPVLAPVSADDAERLIWRGSLRLPESGAYDFAWQNATLLVDGEPWTLPRPLGRGLHAIEVLQEGAQVGQPVDLRWQTPTSGWAPVPASILFTVDPPDQGLLGRYYANESWRGDSVFQQVTPFLLLAWPPGEPVPHPFSATFTGQIRIEEPGYYNFRLDADDGVRFVLDGQVLGEELTPDQPNQIRTGVDLQPGLYSVRIDYFQRGGGSALEFFWQPPGRPETPVPPAVLVPGR